MKDGLETKWNSGEIALHDGTKMKGQVRFNEVSKIVSFKENTKSLDSKSFKEGKVFSLLLIDSLGKKRSFYSFPFEKEILLFEVLKEFKEWAVLARKGMVDAIEGKNDMISTPYGPAKNNRTLLAQEENIFAIDNEGHIEKFQTTLQLEKDGVFDYSRDKSKIDKKILKKFMRVNFDEVENFATQNKLNLKKRDDLIVVLDYYETLVAKD